MIQHWRVSILVLIWHIYIGAFSSFVAVAVVVVVVVLYCSFIFIFVVVMETGSIIMISSKAENRGQCQRANQEEEADLAKGPPPAPRLDDDWQPIWASQN